jgi:soluble lytic murein transglycosylase-like protein
MRMIVGGALMVPAALLMAGERVQQRAVQHSALTSRMDVSGAVTAPGDERLIERERELVVASFAREFDIPQKLASEIHAAALVADIAPRMAFGLVKAESSFRTKVVSPVGAVGLTQLMPSTARWLVPGTSRRDLMEPGTNLRVGFTYLRKLIDDFDGDENLALLAYNRGPGTVSRLLARGADPDNGYADKVLTGESDRHVRLMNAKFGPKSKRNGRS